MEKKDNYELQKQQAQRHFLTYDQQELIHRCRLQYDEAYFYITFLSQPYRICRKSGCMERKAEERWIDGNSFHEVMTILDWLCDSKSDRYITGRWINVVSHRHYFHGNLQEDEDPTARFFDQNPEAFARACRNLGGEAMEGADVSYAIELVDGLKVLVQLWHGDEEFAPRLRCLWDENTEKYLRYETTWYAVGLLMRRIREQMQTK